MGMAGVSEYPCDRGGQRLGEGGRNRQDDEEVALGRPVPGRTDMGEAAREAQETRGRMRHWGQGREIRRDTAPAGAACCSESYVSDTVTSHYH
jgi:hypothetical protein